MSEREIEIWRGQALNIAKDEMLRNKNELDVEVLFNRAKEIFDAAFKYNYFKWGKKEEPQEVPKEKPEWVQCKKCGAWINRNRYSSCKCGEPLP